MSLRKRISTLEIKIKQLKCEHSYHILECFRVSATGFSLKGKCLFCDAEIKFPLSGKELQAVKTLFEFLNKKRNVPK